MFAYFGAVIAFFAYLCSVWAAELPRYQPTESVAGTLNSSGSDTLRPVMERWSEAFKALHPDISFVIESKGSATAPPALTAGSTDIAPMSRPMTVVEIAAFESAHGYKPTAISVALDALAVYVHKDNPIYGLTVQQLDSIFSSTHNCGGEDITRWRDVALGVSPGRAINLHGRNELSGTYASFKREALCGGDFKDGIVIHEDSQAVVEAVAADVNAIGYSGLGYRTDGVRALAIGVGDGFEETRYFPYYVEKYADSPDPEQRYAYVFSGHYPLARSLFLYVNKKTGETVAPNIDAFIRFVLSAQGQEIVEDVGYVPLPADFVAEERAKLAPDYQPKKRWWLF